MLNVQISNLAEDLFNIAKIYLFIEIILSVLMKTIKTMFNLRHETLDRFMQSYRFTH